MKRNCLLSQYTVSIATALLAMVLITGGEAKAQTIWNGATTNYTQPDTDPTVSADQDRLTDRVWLTRAGTLGLFNAALETSYTHNFSPEDTEWAYGTLDNYANLSYTDWEDWTGKNPPNMVGQQAVVHLITDDIYISIVFTRWDQRGGLFAYTRSTPSASGPPPTPNVSITNPAAGAVYAASANVKISADASVSSGSVTNVSFFANTALVGSAQAAPFSMTASNLAAGSYTLTAVATAAGVSATSAPVNITVVMPVAMQLSSPKITNGQFAFDYTANPGLSYVIQSSSNLLNWTALTTNVAATNPSRFSEPFNTNNAKFYRVDRLPNP